MSERGEESLPLKIMKVKSPYSVSQTLYFFSFIESFLVYRVWCLIISLSLTVVVGVYNWASRLGVSLLTLIKVKSMLSLSLVRVYKHRIAFVSCLIFRSDLSY